VDGGVELSLRSQSARYHVPDFMKRMRHSPPTRKVLVHVPRRRFFVQLVLVLVVVPLQSSMTRTI
jgi:hypothetical protein